MICSNSSELTIITNVNIRRDVVKVVFFRGGSYELPVVVAVAFERSSSEFKWFSDSCILFGTIIFSGGRSCEFIVAIAWEDASSNAGNRLFLGAGEYELPVFVSCFASFKLTFDPYDARGESW